MSASAMTLAQMRSFVWNALDTDVTDLTTDLLDRYIIDGSNRVDEFSDSWSFRAGDYTFATVASTQSYNVYNKTLANRVAGIAYPIEKIADLRGTNWSYDPADHMDMRSRFSASSTATGTPYAYSVWGEFLYLWPKPSTAFNVSLTGWRKMSNWTDDTPDAPDFPDEFHELIAWWALNRGHAREGDPQMSDFYRQEFEAALKARSRKYVSGLSAQPFILNGGAQSEPYRTQTALGPLIYTWE